jgi:hypothetical protein
MIVTI